MQVRETVSGRWARILSRPASLLALFVLLVVILLPAEASAITREEVISRAEQWVDAGVMYSQSSYYGGYRQDCSGMVSMAWDTGTSYTSSSIRSQGERIPREEALPGDAVRWPGHVEIFAGWTDESRSSYVALAETNWGKPATRKVRRWQGRYEVWRYDGIEEPSPPGRTPEVLERLEERETADDALEPIESLTTPDQEWAAIAEPAVSPQPSWHGVARLDGSRVP